jgi:hypothetical protein
MPEPRVPDIYVVTPDCLSIRPRSIVVAENPVVDIGAIVTPLDAVGETVGQNVDTPQIRGCPA